MSPSLIKRKKRQSRVRNTISARNATMAKACGNFIKFTTTIIVQNTQRMKTKRFLLLLIPSPSPMMVDHRSKLAKVF